MLGILPFMLVAKNELAYITRILHQAICGCYPSAKIAAADISNCKHALGLLAHAVQRIKPLSCLLAHADFYDAYMPVCHTAPICLGVTQILSAHVTPKHDTLVHTVALHPLSASCVPPWMRLWAVQTSDSCYRLWVMHTTSGVTCRLLSWATDIEAQLGLQRQELRRSRVELASAQEVVPTSLAVETTPHDQKYMHYAVCACFVSMYLPDAISVHTCSVCGMRLHIEFPCRQVTYQHKPMLCECVCVCVQGLCIPLSPMDIAVKGIYIPSMNTSSLLLFMGVHVCALQSDAPLAERAAEVLHTASRLLRPMERTFMLFKVMCNRLKRGATGPAHIAGSLCTSSPSGQSACLASNPRVTSMLCMHTCKQKSYWHPQAEPVQINCQALCCLLI